MKLTKEALQQAKIAKERSELQEEVTRLSEVAKPDSIPNDVWMLMQENGRVATEKLHEILCSAAFDRYSAKDKAALIKLAQERAYGAVMKPSADSSKKGKFIDMTADELNSLAKKTKLPEYRLTLKGDTDE